jgi:protein-L-isoaspartate(D-aspartate) O-methyltransferase
VPLIADDPRHDGNVLAERSAGASGSATAVSPSRASSADHRGGVSAPAQPGPTAAPPVIRRIGLPDLVAEATEQIPSIDDADLESLLERVGTSTLVLIGEASHGTSEFYRMRARITQELIERGRIRFVALEADWPDAARLDRYVRMTERAKRRDELEAFRRFPSWMWSNREVMAFVDWLRAWNERRDPDERVAIHGLDLYSMSESTAEVIAYLQTVDPELADLARRRYGCLTPFQADPSMYAYAAATERYPRERRRGR